MNNIYLLSETYVTVSVLLSLFIFIYNIQFNVPKPHTFVCLPLESRLFGNFNFFSLIRRSFTWPKLLGGISSVAIVALARYGYYGSINIDYTAFLSNTIWGSLAFILRSVFITLFEDNMSLFKLPVDGYETNLKVKKPKNSYNMDNSTSGGDRDSGSTTPTPINPSGSNRLANSEVDYYQRELIVAKNAKKALSKNPASWTPDERYAVECFEIIDDFNNKALDEHISHNNTKLKEAIKNTQSSPQINTSNKRNANYEAEGSSASKHTKG